MTIKRFASGGFMVKGEVVDAYKFGDEREVSFFESGMKFNKKREGMLGVYRMDADLLLYGEQDGFEDVTDAQDKAITKICDYVAENYCV